MIRSNKLKKIAVTKDKNLVKRDQCLRLFSSRRQPPLLVVIEENVFGIIKLNVFLSDDNHLLQGKLIAMDLVKQSGLSQHIHVNKEQS